MHVHANTQQNEERMRKRERENVATDSEILQNRQMTKGVKCIETYRENKRERMKKEREREE